MRVIFPLVSLFILFSFISCSSMGKGPADTAAAGTFYEEEIGPLMFDLTPRDGKLFFFALVTREQYRENEIESCRAEAARQLSRYVQINGVTYSKTRESSKGISVRGSSGNRF